jgi:murein L,D-transpeptidase YafK
MQMKNLLVFFSLCLIALSAIAQPPSVKGGANSYSFIDYQKTFVRPSEALQRKEDTLQKQFEAKKLKWPAKYIYIRSFKYDSQLEVWVKNEVKEPFQLFKTYRVCALAGSLGPKRMEGDYQVPEGFYQINVFNPTSNYYLSLGLNYPNISDKLLSDSMRPGGEIFIHGSCVTVGCIPIRDEQIDELYILAAHAKDKGQDFIPVHIFPIRYNVEKSSKFLANLTKDDNKLKKFTDRLEDAFDYFDKYHQLPVVMVADKGEYIINDVPPRKQKAETDVKTVVKKPAAQHRTRKVDNLPNAVHQWPQYPGGSDAFAKYLEKIGKEMVAYLPAGVKKAFVQVEFIVDADGVPVNFNVLKGSGNLDRDFIDELITRLEKMGTWSPALLHDKPVAKKMIQTVTVEI